MSMEEETVLESVGSPQAQSARTFMFALSTGDGPKLIAFQMTNLLIGRLPDNHLALNHASVSRRHARISLTNRGMIIQDMGSQNGSTVNGVTVDGEHPIRPGDVLRIGYVPMFYFGFVQSENPPQMEIITSAIELTPNVPNV